jgi:hypothetical protein
MAAEQYEPMQYNAEYGYRTSDPYASGTGGGGGTNYNVPYRAPTSGYGTGYGGGFGGTQAGGFGGNSPFFNDPLTQPLMQSWTKRMRQLNTPGPGYGDIEDMFKNALNRDPRMDDALNNLQDMMKRSAPRNAYLDQYGASTQQRMAELNQDPYTASDEAALKARFFDDLARTRDDRTQQLQQRLASMGMAPTSGTAQEAGALLEGEYETARAGQQRDLLKYTTDERNRRRDLAVQLSGGLSGAGAQEAQNQAQFEGQRANIASGLAQLLGSLQDRQLGVAGSLAGLRRQRYLDDMERGGQMLETSALPSALQQQRMAQLQNLLSGQGTPQSIYEQQLAQQKMIDERQRYSDANRTALWGTIGNTIGNVAGSYYGAQNRT